MVNARFFKPFLCVLLSSLFPCIYMIKISWQWPLGMRLNLACVLRMGKYNKLITNHS
jgi:hypothetical protein